jgi:hypothetical protein
MKTSKRVSRYFDMKNATDILKIPVYRAIVLVLLSLGLGVLVNAQDLSDKETCLMCHSAFVWTAPENTDRPRVHNDDGTFIQQTHEMFTCTNCHQDIAQIPHLPEVERGVDCLGCHETVPEK